jgi:hypothetical protein
LTLYLIGKPQPDKSGGVEILDLHLPAKALTGQVYGYIGVCPKRTFLHIAVTNPQIPDCPAELLNEKLRLFPGLHVRLSNNFQEGYPGPVIVQKGYGPGMDHLSRILLKVTLLDPYPLLDVPPHQINVTFLSQGGAELGNLIVLGHIRIEILFPLKPGLLWDTAVEGPGYHAAHTHSLNIEGGKDPRIAHADRAYVGIGLVPKGRTATAKDLGFG